MSSLFSHRRARFLESIGGGIAVVPAAREQSRNSDVDHPFRQDSDFFYLTGFDEADAVAVFDPSGDAPYTLFVRPRDREMEIWNGYRAGVEGAVKDHGADAAHEIGDLDRHLRRMLRGRPVLYYRVGDDAWDRRILPLLAAARAHDQRYGAGAPWRIEDPGPILGEMRLIKTTADLDLLRRACDLSAEGHLEAMRYAAPGRHEFQVQAAMEYVFRAGGSPRNGYPSIVAAGPNACVLHYTENDCALAAGDLLLIDAGAEYGYFSADITRTFPVGGRFTGPQRAVYEVVLAAARAALGECGPGATLRTVHDTAARVLTEGLVDLGLLPLGVEESLAMHHYREFFMHGTSHWLGMDVHDVGAMRAGETHRPLQEGMAFTVEPGLYVDDRTEVRFPLLEYDLDDWARNRYLLGTGAAREEERRRREEAEAITRAVPEEFRGIGVRIEDDVVITADGCENLTARVPTDPDEVEAVCAEQSRVPLSLS